MFYLHLMHAFAFVALMIALCHAYRPRKRRTNAGAAADQGAGRRAPAPGASEPAAGGPASHQRQHLTLARKVGRTMILPANMIMVMIDDYASALGVV